MFYRDQLHRKDHSISGHQLKEGKTAPKITSSFPLSTPFILMVILMHSVHFCVFCPQHNARVPSHVFSIFLEELLNEFTPCQLKSFQGFVCKRWPLLCRAIQLSINNPSFQGGRWCLCSRDPRPVLQVLLRQEVQDVRDQDCRDRRDCSGARFCDLMESWSLLADHAKNDDWRKKRWNKVRFWMNELVLNPLLRLCVILGRLSRSSWSSRVSWSWW